MMSHPNLTSVLMFFPFYLMFDSVAVSLDPTFDASEFEWRGADTLPLVVAKPPFDDLEEFHFLEYSSQNFFSSRY